jgi:hypothetical protein
MESVIFGRPLYGTNLFINQRYDAIWVIPQVDPISAHYFQTLRRRPTQVVPFVWDPIFLEARSQPFVNQGQYRPHSGPRRLSVMEPNHNVVKFCLYPILIIEEAFRKDPDRIALMQVTNAERIAKESPEFITLMLQLDIIQGKKAVFLGRHDTPQFLAENTDIVVSHQWENALNYFYLEVCWQGYPLIHNATLCSELGYFYSANDVQQGAGQLLHAMHHHDEAAADYLAAQRSAIGRFLPNSDQVVSAYSRLLANLAQAPVR